MVTFDLLTNYNRAVRRRYAYFPLSLTKFNLNLVSYLTECGLLLGYRKRFTYLIVYPRYIKGSPLIPSIKSASALGRNPNGLVLFSSSSGFSWSKGVPIFILLNR